MKGLSSGKAQKIYPGKWTLAGKRSELQQKLREFVEEAGLLASLCQKVTRGFRGTLCDAGQSSPKGLGRGRPFVRTAALRVSRGFCVVCCNGSARIPAVAVFSFAWILSSS